MIAIKIDGADANAGPFATFGEAFRFAAGNGVLWEAKKSVLFEVKKGKTIANESDKQ
jgi:hypothetical protein